MVIGHGSSFGGSIDLGVGLVWKERSVGLCPLVSFLHGEKQDGMRVEER